MIFQREDKARVKRQKTEQAIQLALQNRWVEAAEVNRVIIELFPNDVEAYNRLGKALTELGRYAEGREAYAKALELDRSNTIARKNLERLAAITERAVAAPPAETGRKASPNLFISEVGKSGATTLINTAPHVLTKTVVGDEVFLGRRNGNLVVENAKGEYLGEVDPRLGLRLLKLMEGGNRYTAAITSLAEEDVRILIKETHQHPSQAGKLSFLPTAGEAFRSDIKPSLLKHEAGEESLPDDEELEEWEGEPQAKEIENRLYDEQAPVAVEEAEEEYEE